MTEAMKDKAITLKIAAYCRVSTEKDAQLDSLKNQELFFREYAVKNDYELFRVYADEGISGKQMKNRREFLQMLEDSRKGLFQMVVVKDISRFARNTVDFLNAIRELRGRNIEVRFLSNHQTVLGNSEFILTIFSAMAQEESANLSKRVKFGKKINAEKGRVPNNVYGYDQVNTFTLIINEQQAETVRQIFELYIKGMGVRKIASYLNAQGVPTKHGACWEPRTIRRMLENPLYHGILENHKEEIQDFLTGKRQMLPEEEHFFHYRPEYRIIEDRVFQQVQFLLKERGQNRCGRYSSRYPFSGLIFCGCCGYAFSRHVYHGKQRDTVWWRCCGNGNLGKGFCKNHVILREKDLLEALEGYLIPDAEVMEKLILTEAATASRRLETVESYERESGKQLARLEKYKRMYENGIIPMEELKNTAEQIRNRLKSLKETAENKDCLEEYIRKNLLEYCSLFYWDNTDFRKLIEKITVEQDGKVTISFHL